MTDVLVEREMAYPAEKVQATDCKQGFKSSWGAVNMIRRELIIPIRSSM